ncbi:hypothetical protein HJC22_31700 [Corallococcus exiguus]|uniref:hypothetical protein n=1 Tax=Corallococcus TaxID=83461 RepID=UPI000EA082DC|nr:MULTISPECIES: hypothetical protein [Corallococcus]NNC20296.1 hypothetical protein [Corallococcus exiguus]RKH18809.1 hypothetical protein D7V77_33530 [Corallococcus sp. CA041A]RUO93887.1 hypothetical protein D7Y11_07260 [Corallococcus sp. AB018]
MSPFKDGAREPVKMRGLFAAWFPREERRWLGEFLSPERFACAYVGLEEPVDATRKCTPAQKTHQDESKEPLLRTLRLLGRILKAQLSPTARVGGGKDWLHSRAHLPRAWRK